MGRRAALSLPGQTRLLGLHGGGDDWIEVLHKVLFPQQLRTPRSVAFLVPGTEILTDKGAMAVWEVAVVDLFGVIYASCQRFEGSKLLLQVEAHDSADGDTDVLLSSSSCHNLRGDTRTSYPGPSGCVDASWTILERRPVRRGRRHLHSRCLCCASCLERPLRRDLANLTRSSAPCHSSYGPPQHQSSKDVLRGVGEPASSWQTIESEYRLGTRSLTSAAAAPTGDLTL